MSNVTPTLMPEQIEELRKKAEQAISPIKPASQLGNLFFEATRTEAGRDLPEYYLVYFLLVELLKFPHGGRWEKIAWSVPIEFEGTNYLIDHRKFGVGVFCKDPGAHEDQAKRIVSLISKGVKAADPFFRSLAEDAVRQSRVNVRNLSASLFQRYEYLRDHFRKAQAEVEARKHEVETQTTSDGGTAYNFPKYRLMKEARWMGTAAVDAFYAWTEHVLIQLAIIQGKVTTGLEVDELSGQDWSVKFKRALDITDIDTKRFYDSLVTIRRQIRNYTAHGSFGKQREAFDFHSAAGAVPVILDERPGHFSFIGEPAFEEEAAISTIEEFIVHLWAGPRHPAWQYIQEESLPLILTYAKDGTYMNAMQSDEHMEEFIYGLSRSMDDAANMDW